VPESGISPYHEQFLATIFIASHSNAIRAPYSSGRLAQLRPIAPAAIWRVLPDLPNVSIATAGEDLLSVILIAPGRELIA
jgi:hypothetical protein